MKQKTILTATLVGGTLAGMGLGLTATRWTPPVKAAPGLATPAPPAGAMADLYSGKMYPVTLKAEQIDSSYHMVALVDAQGRTSLYATRGETVAGGGETFLVCYDVPVTNSKTHPPLPQAGATANLIYINMHAVEAMTAVIAIPSAADAPAPVPAAP